MITFETNSATEWQYSQHPENFRPNLFVEVSEEDVQAKIDALGEYKFEIRDYPVIASRAVNAPAHTVVYFLAAVN